MAVSDSGLPEQDAPLRHIQALERGTRLLRVIAQSGQPLTGVEAADRADLNRSTAWRLLATLEQEDIVERDDSGRYQVGIGLFTIASASAWGSVARRARPILEALSAETNESAVIAVVNGGGYDILDQVDGPHALSVRWVGARLPLASTSVGKLILASLDDRDLDAFLSRPIEARTERTLTDRDDVRAELEEVRRTGIAISNGDYEIGVNGVAAAARDGRNRPVAFVVVTGPEVRLPEERMKAVAPLLLTAAAQLEVALGFGDGATTRP